jgi:hypothetical protein
VVSISTVSIMYWASDGMSRLLIDNARAGVEQSGMPYRLLIFVEPCRRNELW